MTVGLFVSTSHMSYDVSHKPSIANSSDTAFYRPPCRVLICLSGKRKSGKDFFAARLREQLGSLVLDALQLNDLIVSVDVVGVSFSLKDQYARLNGLDAQRLRDDSDYKETVRSEMVEYGERIRQKDPGFFCREALRRVVPLVDDSIQLASTSHLDGGLQIIIVSDCRRPSDLAYFRKVSAYNFDPERELSTPEADADDEYDARCDFSAPTQRTSILPILVRINADEGTRRARGLRFVAGIDDAPTECALDGDDVPWDVCVHNDGDSPLNEAIRRIATLCAKRISLVSNASMHSSGSSL